MYKGDEYLYVEFKYGPEDKWERSRTLWPKTCCSSGEKISMFGKGYVCRTPMNAGCGSVIMNERWLTESEYLFKKLKGEV